jgi:Neurotransmitter-gated ion-channel transmembrane region
VGERVGLAITSLLASVASDLTVSAKLPAASEYNWFAYFSLINMVFSVVVVFQSAIVIYFHYYTGSDLKPTYVKWMMQKWKEWQAKRKMQVKDSSPTTTEHDSPPQPGSRRVTAPLDLDLADSDADSLGNFSGSKSFPAAGLRVHHATACRPGIASDPLESQISPPTYHDGGNVPQINGGNFADTLAGASSGGALQASTTSFDASFLADGGRRTGPRERRNSTFPQDAFPKDADDYRDVEEKDNNMRWQGVASLIDEFSRVIFPLAYAVFLGIVFQRAGNSMSS